MLKYMKFVLSVLLLNKQLIINSTKKQMLIEITAYDKNFLFVVFD